MHLLQEDEAGWVTSVALLRPLILMEVLLHYAVGALAGAV